MYQERRKLYRQLERARNSKVIAYITGDRPNMHTQIHPEVIDMFSDLLDVSFRRSNKISLFLYSRGGVTLAGWNIVNLIRMFCDEFEVIIPSVAHSTATLISIGADKIVMTKQATLGPIDPSTNSQFNPRDPSGVPGLPPLPVSVEDVSGFFNLARKELGEEAGLLPCFQQLTQQVHPLALGGVARARDQIKMLAERLLQNHMKDSTKREKVIAFLCSDSGSHDYTINRREAEKDLSLPIEKPDDRLYKIIKGIYYNFRNDLQLRSQFNPMLLLAGGNGQEVPYSCPRSFLESMDGGSYQYRSSGVVMPMAQGLQQVQGQQISIPIQAAFDQRTEDGWVYESAK